MWDSLLRGRNQKHPEYCEEASPSLEKSRGGSSPTSERARSQCNVRRPDETPVSAPFTIASSASVYHDVIFTTCRCDGEAVGAEVMLDPV